MKRGDIYVVDLNPTIGHEQRGHRPVLIISPDAFNELTHNPIILPITTGGQFAKQNGCAVPLLDTNLKTTGIIRCDQPRAIDLRRRNGRKVESVSTALIQDVLARLETLLT